MSFGTDLAQFQAKTGLKLDIVHRKVVIDMTGELVQMTPVGDPTFWKRQAPPGYTGGHARSNYFWGVSRLNSVDPSTDKTGSVSVNRAVAFAANLRAGGIVYLTNSLPYIMALEYGHSERQAPHGMARITVARWQERVNKAVRS